MDLLDPSLEDLFNFCNRSFTIHTTCSLPWQGLKAKIKQQKYEKIVELEQTISIEELCSDLLLQIITINLYVKSLTFDEQSDYDHIKRQLRTIIVVNNGK
ncbi:unnamed protein product [Rotaria sp. Silwood1]|nr:unnamed protein product [Rotaria sp. Silwood1]